MSTALFMLAIAAVLSIPIARAQGRRRTAVQSRARHRAANGRRA